MARSPEEPWLPPEQPTAEDAFVQKLLAGFTNSFNSSKRAEKELPQAVLSIGAGNIESGYRDLEQSQARPSEPSLEPQAKAHLQSPHFTPPSEPGTESPLEQEAPLLHGNGHLAYGGLPAKTPYKVGCKPSAGTTFRKQRRYELIARMENAGLPEGQIAALLGISKVRLRSTKQHPDYLKARMAITLGIIVDQDGKLSQIREQGKELIRQMLPPALQIIANAVHTYPQNLAERKLQIAVAQDILDREGTFAKISRSEVKPVEHFDWESTDAAATNAVNLIKGTLRVSQSAEGAGEARTKIDKIIEISRAFSSGRSPNPESQMQALKDLELEKEA